MRIAVLLAALAFTTPAHAQSATLGGSGTLDGSGTPGCEVTFDPLSIAEFEVSDIYNVDQAFAETYDIPVLANTRLLVPNHTDLHVRAVAAPDGGAILAFVFSKPGETREQLVFLEDLQVTNAVIPMYADSSDPVHERRLTAARLLEEEIFPQWASRYEGAEIFAIEAIELGNVPDALQMIAGYYDPDFDDNIMMRAVILPHPSQPESYMAVATINLDELPVTDAATLAATISGRVISSWQYQ